MGMKALDELELPPLTVENADDGGLEELKASIIENGCREYLSAYRAWRIAENEQQKIIARSWLYHHEVFFRSAWFATLIGDEDIDGESLMRRLRRHPPRKYLLPTEKQAMEEDIERQVQEGRRVGVYIDAETIERRIVTGDYIGRTPSAEYLEKLKSRRKHEHDVIKARYKAREQGHG